MEVNLIHIKHSTILVQLADLQFVFDPFSLDTSDLEQFNLSSANNVLFITHPHFDHFSLEDTKKIIDLGIKFSTVVYPYTMVGEIKQLFDSLVAAEKLSVKPGENVQLGTVGVRGVPAYNINKLNPDTGRPYHPKDAGWLGYMISFGTPVRFIVSAPVFTRPVELEGSRVYISGDTDCNPDMLSMVNKVDIAFLPVSGVYVMTVDEAVRCAGQLGVQLSVPVHYGVIAGSKEDAYKFVEQAAH